MQGKSLKVTFPAETFNFISNITKKMTTTPAKQPLPDGTFQTLIDPRNGQPVPMSKTGKVEEFIHFAIIQALFTIIMSDPTDPTFLPERMKLQTEITKYGDFIQAFLGDKQDNANATQKTTKTTTTVTTVRK